MTVALRQTTRSPRVLRTHLHAYLCRIYAATSVQVSGFACIGLLTPLRRLYPLAVRQSSALPTASSGFRLTVDTLAVQLTLPLAGCVEDLHLQVNAPCRAHQKKVACAPFNKERRMKFANATKSHRKSGVVEGPAVSFFRSLAPTPNLGPVDAGTGLAAWSRLR